MTEQCSPAISPPVFSEYAELEQYLAGRGLFRMELGLERMRESLGLLGLQRPPFFVAQVVGTNGKGSTSTFLASLAAAHGLTVGLHTSPHFVSVRERIRINGAMLPEVEWVQAANVLMQQGQGVRLTYFELITCLAVQLFARHNVAFAVMETGLGGTFDATTALEADMVLFTPVDLDHTAILGETLAAVATDKAGAMRRGKQALSGPQHGSVVAVLEDVAQRVQAPLLFCGPSESILPEPPVALGLAGAHQHGNAALALAGWRLFQANPTVGAPALAGNAASACVAMAGNAAAEAHGLASARIAGRMQRTAWLPGPRRLGRLETPYGVPPMVLDGGHNPHGLAALGLSLAKEGVAPLATVFACLEDKNVAAMVAHVRAMSPGAIFVPPIADNPRSMAPQALASAIGLNAFACASVEEALCRAAEHMHQRMPEAFAEEGGKHPLLVCGSLYMLGEVYSLLPELLGC